MSRSRILVIQDSYPIKVAMSSALRRAGFIADDCALGEEALERAAAQRFDVIVVDDIVPDANGFDLMQTLRARGFQGRFIFTSTSPDFIRCALQRGADRALMIPMGDDALLEAVSALTANA